MPQRTFYVTTPIYYVNGVPHIGNAYTTIAADVMARYKRSMGFDVMFLTGTDEHGQKVQSAASERGVAPQEYVDEMARVWIDLLDKLHISNDDFIRTTEPRHVKGVLKLLDRIIANGDVYQDEYEGWYCRHEENFLTDLQVQDGKCPECGRPVERASESAYFFALSKYEKPLLDYYASHPEFIRPDFRMNEVRRFVEGGLKDLCISRYKLRWGIPIPKAEDHSLYVWIDALINYLTGVGFGTDENMFNHFWPCDLHLLGKDILKFHCVYWPAMLMSAKVPLPKALFNHGWLRVQGQKMSKSVGNVVDPFYLIEAYGAETVRYFLMRDVQFGQDGNFSEENLVKRHNSDLVNDLGNLIHRSLSMCKKYFDDRVPSPGDHTNADLRKACEATFASYSGLMDELDFRSALETVWGLVSMANTFIDHQKPWEVFKRGDIDQLGGILYSVLEVGRIILCMLRPFIPLASDKALNMMGIEPTAYERLSELVKWGGLAEGTEISEIAHPFERTEMKAAPTPSEAPAERKEKKGKSMTKPTITIDDFGKVELVVGKIISCEPVPGSKSLLKISVDIGTEVRTAVAGMKKHYTPDEIVGKKIAFVANLAPATIFGVESTGMVLAAAGDDVSLLVVDKDVPLGTTIR